MKRIFAVIFSVCMFFSLVSCARLNKIKVPSPKDNHATALTKIISTKLNAEGKICQTNQIT